MKYSGTGITFPITTLEGHTNVDNVFIIECPFILAAVQILRADIDDEATKQASRAIDLKAKLKQSDSTQIEMRKGYSIINTLSTLVPPSNVVVGNAMPVPSSSV